MIPDCIHQRKKTATLDRLQIVSYSPSQSLRVCLPECVARTQKIGPGRCVARWCHPSGRDVQPWGLSALGGCHPVWRRWPDQLFMVGCQKMWRCVTRWCHPPGKSFCGVSPPCRCELSHTVVAVVRGSEAISCQVCERFVRRAVQGYLRPWKGIASGFCVTATTTQNPSQRHANPVPMPPTGEMGSIMLSPGSSSRNAVYEDEVN